MLPRCYPYAFEFRHTSWYDDDIYELLRAHDVSLCLSDHHDAPSPWEVTARHVYLRGHGPDGRYKDHYPDKTLRTWARHIGNWRTPAAHGVRLFRQRPEERRPDRRTPIVRATAASGPINWLFPRSSHEKQVADVVAGLADAGGFPALPDHRQCPRFMPCHACSDAQMPSQSPTMQSKTVALAVQDRSLGPA